MRISVASLTLIFLFASTSEAASLCKKDEIEFFTCHLKSKIAVLCGAKDKNSGHLYMQYKTMKKSRLEFIYPAKYSDASLSFKQSYWTLPHGEYIAVSFSSAQYKYILRQAWDTHSPGWAAITVLKQGKLLTENSCNDELGYEPSFLAHLPQGTLPPEDYWWP